MLSLAPKSSQVSLFLAALAGLSAASGEGVVVAGMTGDGARFAYLAEGNAKQARKRVAADLLIRDEAGRVLLVNPL
ncbi:hypothetical protein ACTG9Q_28240 [Actinokineospora sp. 24-640]